MLGMHGTKAANLAIRDCDLLVGVGVRFDDRATGKLSEFAPNAKVLHLDVDPAEVGKLRRPDVALVGSLEASLEALFEAGAASLDIASWRRACARLKEEHRRDYDMPADGIYGPPLSQETLRSGRPGHDLRLRCRSASDVGGATLPLRAARAASHERRSRHDGLRAPGGHRGPFWMSGPNGREREGIHEPPHFATSSHDKHAKGPLAFTLAEHELFSFLVRKGIDAAKLRSDFRRKAVLSPSVAHGRRPWEASSRSARCRPWQSL